MNDDARLQEYPSPRHPEDAQDPALEERRSHQRNEEALDVIAALRGLGFKVDRAREAAQHSAELPDATLEDRIRAALRYLRPRSFDQRGTGSHAPM